MKYKFVNTKNNMPLPTPTTEESKPDFLARCMSDAKMLIEYPDAAQRYAVCQMQYEEK